MRKFSQALKWGLFFAIFPIIEPYFSPPDLLFIGRQKIFIVLSIITLTWIIIEFSNVLRYIFLEKFTYDKEDNLRERRVVTQVAFIRRLFIIAILVIAIAAIWGTVFLYVDITVEISKINTKLKEILEATPFWGKKVQVLQVTD